jgi:hypothetical protein
MFSLRWREIAGVRAKQEMIDILTSFLSSVTGEEVKRTLFPQVRAS